MQTNIQNGNSKTATSRLSETQKAVWTYCHVHRGTPAYHICMRFGPFPDLDIQRLKTAAELAVNTVRKWLNENDLDMTVVFNVFVGEDEHIYRELLGI